MKKSYEIDMCNGPLWGKLLLFSVPLILSGILQLLFNAADIVVVGRFSGNHALAAVGSTSSLIQLFVMYLSDVLLEQMSWLAGSAGQRMPKMSVKPCTRLFCSVSSAAVSSYFWEWHLPDICWNGWQRLRRFWDRQCSI